MPQAYVRGFSNALPPAARWGRQILLYLFIFVNCIYCILVNHTVLFCERSWNPATSDPSWSISSFSFRVRPDIFNVIATWLRYITFIFNNCLEDQMIGSGSLDSNDMDDLSKAKHASAKFMSGNHNDNGALEVMPGWPDAAPRALWRWIVCVSTFGCEVRSRSFPFTFLRCLGDVGDVGAGYIPKKHQCNVATWKCSWLMMEWVTRWGR